MTGRIRLVVVINERLTKSCSRCLPHMAMKDEYGVMNSDGNTAVVHDFKMDCGRTLSKAELLYRTWGSLNESRDNVIVVCHALTGNANVESWWSKLLGPCKAIDTSKYFVFCANVLGSCYGSSGPASTNPETGRRYGMSFPPVTIRDMVRLMEEVLLQLDVRGVAVAIGGSMGGMQALEFALEPRHLRARAVVSLSSSGRHQPWQIGISECQRQAIFADPLWQDGAYDPEHPPRRGLEVARMMAMVTYRTHPGYWTKFGRGRARKGSGPEAPDVYDVEGYLIHQGQSFHKRGFDAASYVTLTRAMDSHDVARGRGDYTEVLGGITVPVLVVSISSDVLYPVSEQLELAQLIPGGQHHLIQSDEGHDGFLLEHVQVGTLVRGFLGTLECEGVVTTLVQQSKL
ncbi:unnamed protein product [Prorocentrum cordatum]|uniref:AB hydrolase-1 domain-containing protein n=2 Tax=Prorocentrum cordatum TaxID=2364126 RepID=A0ABN9U516_9DINO|nr:unnamed protein product [Polarella glacialis]